MEMSAPRTRDEETEFYMEAGTFDHMDEPDYEPPDTDPDFDLSDNDQEVDQWAC